MISADETSRFYCDSVVWDGRIEEFCPYDLKLFNLEFHDLRHDVNSYSPLHPSAWKSRQADKTKEAVWWTSPNPPEWREEDLLSLITEGVEETVGLDYKSRCYYCVRKGEENRLTNGLIDRKMKGLLNFIHYLNNTRI